MHRQPPATTAGRTARSLVMLSLALCSGLLVSGLSAPSAGASTPTPAPAALGHQVPATHKAPTGKLHQRGPIQATARHIVDVGTAAELSAALSAATPGTTVRMAPGTYVGNFTIATSGTAAAPIRLTGPGAVLSGTSVSSCYVLHLDNADYVDIRGITVTNAQKGVVLDQSSHDRLTRLDVNHTGDELVLLRNFSSDNVIARCQIHDSGLTTPGYGEGIYVGLSVTNWNSSGQSRTGGAPDESDGNRIVGNHIWDTSAENVDIKEGTSGGVIADNTFDSTGMTGANYADSWVDVAGNDYLVTANTGENPGSALVDGYQTHVILAGWGMNNTFSSNNSAVNSTGYGFNIQTSGSGNQVASDNVVTGAARGTANVALT